MTLDQYLSLDGQTASALATRAGTTAASITRLLYGDQQPSADMIRSIVRASNGDITAHDLIFGAPRVRQTSGAPPQAAA